jgi:hypothetical protein
MGMVMFFRARAVVPPVAVQRRPAGPVTRQVTRPVTGPAASPESARGALPH